MLYLEQTLEVEIKTYEALIARYKKEEGIEAASMVVAYGFALESLNNVKKASEEKVEFPF